MKYCPTCNRRYDEETLRFCLDDGTLLLNTYDSEATRVIPPQQVFTLPATQVWQSSPSTAQPPTTTRNPAIAYAVIAVIVLLAVVAGGAVMWLLMSANKNVNQTINSTGNRNTQQSQRVVQASPQVVDPGATTPLTIRASASSVRLPIQTNTYNAANAADGKPNTAWVEGVYGPGIGEWIRFDFDSDIAIERILVQPGYFKSPTIWSENNRIASVRAEFSNGSSRNLTFTDEMKTQSIEMGGIRTSWVRLTIESIYRGTVPGKYDDTALSEVTFEWQR